MVAGRFSTYLEELRRELYLRFGRTHGSWVVQQILAEVRGHLEDSFRELREAGAAEDEAEREAEQRFGRPAVVARAYDNSRHQSPTRSRGAPGLRRPPDERLESENIMSALLREVRFALRGLRRAPGYTLAFVLTLGLGIGADTAIFSIVNGVLLRPLPYRDGHELLYLRQSAPLAGIGNALFSVPEIREYRDGVASFEGVAEFSALTFTMLGFDEPRRVRAGIVTGNYFDVMGFGPVLGRVINAGDDGGAAVPVMVLTHSYWMSTFGGDRGVIGRRIRMNGKSVEIVGVAEPVPPYPEETDIYVNMVTSQHHLSAMMQTNREHRMTEVFARLTPGATIEQARREIDQVESQAHAAFPETYDESQGYAVAATPLRDQLAARAHTVFLLLLGAAGFVLLLACANVANLTLARVLRRRHELSVRASLGAGTAVLRRQLLMENLVPSLMGAGLGLFIATLGLDALVQYAARYTVRATEISIDGTVFAVTFAVGVGAACLFAFMPRLPGQRWGGLIGQGAAVSRRRFGGRGGFGGAAPRPRLGVASRGPASRGGSISLAGARATAGVAGRRLQQSLVVVQVAVCFVLLIGAGLLLRTLLNLERADGGVDLDTVLTLGIPPGNGARTADESRLFYQGLTDGVGALPGVRGVALGTRVPLVGAPEGLGAQLANFEFDIESVPVDAGAQQPRADFRIVTPGYFDVLGMHIVRGRGFAATDTADAPLAVVINEAMVRAYFPDRDPIGQRIRWTGALVSILEVDPGYRTVVGVVSDSNDFGITNVVPHVVFHPLAQEPGASVLFVRSDQPTALARGAAQIVHELDPDQPVLNVATLEQVRADAIAPQRLNAALLGAFALLAVAIASVGVAGVLAFSVSQRTRELGVRAALGADRRRLVATILGEGALMAGGGLLIGGVAAAGLSRLAAGLLFEVDPTDAMTFATVSVLLLAVSLASAWLPARRASRIDPVAALRTQ